MFLHGHVILKARDISCGSEVLALLALGTLSFGRT
jgi:hypothetical protein